MKTSINFLIALFIIGFTNLSSAQTADEIIDTYFENTGGKERWEKLDALKSIGSLDFGTMTLPVTMIQTKEGLTLMSADVQGQAYYQTVYDGETLWSTNQMTMAAEKSDAEATANYTLGIQDFPDPFLNYKSKGYSLELMGSETVDGTDTFKIKLEKKPKMVNGKEEANIEYYYFEKENFVPILIEKEVKLGPEAGAIGHSKLSNYQEVDGIYFPFSIVDGTKDQPGEQAITITTIELNPQIDKAVFAFPEKN
jgi:outer membrane lipoprotein-sorting protein